MNSIPLFKCDVGPPAYDVVNTLFQSGQLAGGSHVRFLEEEVSKFLGGANVVAMGDMTHALTLALKLSGVKAGDEVLTLSYNCLSSTTAITAAGAVPVWVDVDVSSATFSLSDAELAITARTKAVIVYHVAGYPANVAAIRAFCDARKLAFIEDANSAIGANFGNRAVGTVGDFAIFSFYANRQVNGIEGAVLVCKNPDAAAEARQLRRFGIDSASFRDGDGEINPASDIPLIGMSSAMSNVNAAVARSSLAELADRLARTRENVISMELKLAGNEKVKAVRWQLDSQPSFWVWLLLCEERDNLMRALKKESVQCSKLHQSNHIYSGFHTTSKALPGTNTLMSKVLALPCGWWMDNSSMSRMVDLINIHSH